MNYVSECLVDECLKLWSFELQEGHGWAYGALHWKGSQAS